MNLKISGIDFGTNTQTLETSATLTTLNRGLLHRTETGSVKYNIERKPLSTLELKAETMTNGATYKSTWDSWYYNNQEPAGSLFLESLALGGQFFKCFWDHSRGAYKSSVLRGHDEHYEFTFNFIFETPPTSGSFLDMSEWGLEFNVFDNEKYDATCFDEMGFLHINSYSDNNKTLSFSVPKMDTAEMLELWGWVNDNFYQLVTVSLPVIGNITGYLDVGSVTFSWPSGGDKEYWQSSQLKLTGLI